MSESALAFFFGAAFGFAAAFGLAVAPAGRPRGFAGPAAFFVAATFGFAAALVAFAGFAGGAKSELAPSSKTESSIRESSIAGYCRVPKDEKKKLKTINALYREVQAM
jgi:hypothetical protein